MILSSINIGDDLKVLKIERVRTKTRNQILIISVFLVLLYICFFTFFTTSSLSIYGFILYVISICFIEWGILDILGNGISVSNVFAFTYFIFLAINCFNISGLQKEKNFESIYYLVFGAIIFIVCVRIFEKNKTKHLIRNKLINTNILAMAFFTLFVLLKLVVFKRTGIRLFDANYESGAGANYTVGGISGLTDMLMWISLMFIPLINRKYKVIISIGAFILYGVFALSRNNMMLIMVFLIICFVQSKGKNILVDKKIMRRLILLGLIVLLAFTVLGNYRQAQRGWTNPATTVQKLLQSKTNNSVVNWTYSYTSINYDVILQCMVNREHPYTLYSIFSPLTRLTRDYGGLTVFEDEAFHIRGLNGYNASTIFGPMIYELGELYIIGAIFLGVIVGLWIYIARMENAKGFLAYLMTWAAMSVFGNYYTITIYFYISIAACVVFALFGERKQDR